ncbi:hypothetical protein PVAP13_5KG482507 [Panicum virgatum]|uniref:Uncharacterized protein n=1 Tax=Panicum virgatum TaxID=38727 RepID=A0A8T0SV70_PANVG|nr:hypothetical protein PVAP13_5KG482507 [Panicum virgatum]
MIDCREKSFPPTAGDLVPPQPPAQISRSIAGPLPIPSPFPPIKSLRPPVLSRHHSRGPTVHASCLPSLSSLPQPRRDPLWMQQRGRSFNRRSRSFSRARLAIEGS